MKLSEISYPQTAAQLNEHLGKTFGTKFNLENFTLEQLEDRRNKIRTKIRSIETMESYNKTQTEEYNKNKMFLDVLNAAISERSFTESTIKGVKSHKLKEAPGDRIPVANQPKQKAPPVAPTTTGMQVGMKAGPLEIDFEQAWTDFSNRLMRGVKKTGGNLQQAGNELENMKLRFMNMWKRTQKKSPRTQTFNSQYDEGIMYTQGSKLREGAEEQAELVMAAKKLVDNVGGWLEDVSEMQSKEMLKLQDAIRDELGSEQAQSFIDATKPTLEALYQALDAARTALNQGVTLLTGEGAPQDEMGAEPAPEGEMEPTVDAEAGMEAGMEAEMGAEMDAAAGDEFAGAAAAGGGMEEAGRPQRESVAHLSRNLGQILSSKKK